MTAGRRCVTVRVTGRVQGVGFRDWTVGEARRLGLEGWVRNQSDGSVQAVIAGSEAAISSMLEAFRHGPPGARVADVTQEHGDDVGLSGFVIAP
jgi:acylphosphatase